MKLTACFHIPYPEPKNGVEWALGSLAGFGVTFLPALLTASVKPLEKQ